MFDYNIVQFLITLHLLVALGAATIFKNNSKITGYFSVVVSILNTIFLGIVLSENPGEVKNWNWFSWKSIGVQFGFLLDFKSVAMLFLVNFIATLVSLFSSKYLQNDNGLSRYFAFLSLFVVAMMLLLVSTNLIQLYFFWELVGFFSYLMVGFWYTKPAAIAASKKAFLVNRIGDVGFAIAIFLLLKAGHNTNLLELNTIGTNNIIAICLLVACMAKSAQFPLHFWLPNAMEGPTPISALIHAATMVAAGVYLIIRTLPLFGEMALNVALCIGFITMFMGAAKAFLQTDIKKILAYSTISQLGIMVIALGLNNAEASFFHLYTHAFFKAGLFLGAGAIIHFMHEQYHNMDPQDIRNIKGLYRANPLLAIAFLIMLAALVGFPGSAGFVSKDLIIELAFAQNTLLGLGMLLGTVLTSMYCFRLVYVVFFGANNISFKLPFQFSIPIFILAFFSTLCLVYFWPGAHFHFSYVTILALGAILGGFGLSFLFKKYYFLSPKYTSPFDWLYDILMSKLFLKFSTLFNWFDKNIVEGAIVFLEKITFFLSEIAVWVDKYIIDGAVQFLINISSFLGQRLRTLQAGQLQWYVASLIAFLFVLYGVFVTIH